MNIVLVIHMVFVTMLTEHWFYVLDGAHECVLWSYEPFIKDYFLQHIVSVVTLPCHLDCWRLAQCLLDRVLGFAFVIEFNPLWVPLGSSLMVNNLAMVTLIVWLLTVVHKMLERK